MRSLLVLVLSLVSVFTPPAVVSGGGSGGGITFIYVPTNPTVAVPTPAPTQVATPLPTQQPQDPTPQPTTIPMPAPTPTPAPARHSGVVVAVIDSGVDMYHPDFAGTLVGGWGHVQGYHGPDFNDRKGHGTNVAGVLALYSNVKIMPLRCGAMHNESSDLAWCFRYAADQGVDYIVASVYANPTEELHEAVRYARNKGIPVVAAAGNHFTERPRGMYPTNEPGGCYYPAAYPETIAVGATDHSGKPAWWSAKGSCVDVWVTGVDIFTLSPRYPHYGTEYGYRTSRGTSFAAPLWVAIREGGGLNYRRGE